MVDLRDQVSSTMYAAISAATNKPIEELDDNAELVADLGVKSVNLVRIIAALEDEHELEIPFAEFRKKKTIGEAISYIVQLCES